MNRFRFTVNSAKNKKLGYTIYVEINALRGFEIIMESLILAQNERWRRVLSMQVEWQDKSLL